jgi:hypothetical protein
MRGSRRTWLLLSTFICASVSFTLTLWNFSCDWFAEIGVCQGQAYGSLWVEVVMIINNGNRHTDSRAFGRIRTRV